jgi:hypothetical protein
LGAEVFAVAAGPDEVVVDFDRFNAGETHPPVSRDAIEPAEEVPESLGGITGGEIVGIDAVVAHMDAADDDFAVAVFDECADFVFNIRWAAAAESGADGGNDAIGALEDAAVLDLDERALATFEVGDAGGKVGDAEACEDIGEFAFVGDHFDDVGKPGDSAWVACGVAAHDDGFAGRILAGKLTDDLARFGVAGVGDCAGVDNAEVSRLVLRGFPIAALEQSFANELRFVLVDLAAKGDESTGRHK